MADTGPPHDLPYPLSTEVVRDGASRIQQLAEAANAVIPTGIGSNVVFADFPSAISLAPADVPGASVTITLSAATSKVLVITGMSEFSQFAGNLDFGYFCRLRRGTTNLRLITGKQSAPNDNFGPGFILHVDTPGTVGPHTYNLRTDANPMASPLPTIRIGAGVIAAIEIAA